MGMPELREDGYPYIDCAIRKYYAYLYGVHFSGAICPYECEKYEEYKSMRNMYD